MKLSQKIEPVRHLLESRASTDDIQIAFMKATGTQPNKRVVQEWRRYVGAPLPRGLRHDLDTTPESQHVAQVQSLVKKYWIPTNGNPLLC